MWTISFNSTSKISILWAAQRDETITHGVAWGVPAWSRAPHVRGATKTPRFFSIDKKKPKSRPQCNSHKKHSITENFLLHWSQLMNIPNDNCTYNECVQLVWLKKRIGRGGKFFGGPRVAKNHATPLPICMKPPRQK